MLSQSSELCLRMLLVHVLACPADPSRLYDWGQTGPNTDFSTKNQKMGSRGPEVGLGWGYKVDGHMPWGALSGSRLVLGHKRVFWGLGGGFRAAVAQYLRYMHMPIDTYTYM